MAPQSCDTFVVVGDGKGPVIFGKNSDRPQGEVQEVVFQARATHPAGSTVKCTYIEVDQVEETAAVVLSKPAWMWGAEMGANEYSVAIGNEAIWTKVLAQEQSAEKKLLGMDLLRLGLERSKTAREALDVITKLLEKHGQGGPCSMTDSGFAYHNSFIIADPKEAWVLETAGTFWAAEHIQSGHRNISNVLSIGTKIDLMSDGLKDKAKELGFWDGNSEFNFAAIFEDGGGKNDPRFKAAKALLGELAAKSFGVKEMMKILRDRDSGVCRSCDSPFPTQGAQVSALYPEGGRPSSHYFTGTPDPKHSVFKPFVFCPGVQNAPAIISPGSGEEHRLYKLHQAIYSTLSDAASGQQLSESLADLESQSIDEIESMLNSIKGEDIQAAVESLQLQTLFSDSVEAELRFYK